MLIFVIFWELSIYPNIFKVLLVQFIPSIGRVQSQYRSLEFGAYHMPLNSLQTTAESWFELSLLLLFHQKAFDGLQVGHGPVHLRHSLTMHWVADGKKPVLIFDGFFCRISPTPQTWLGGFQWHVMSRDVFSELPTCVSNKYCYLEEKKQADWSLLPLIFFWVQNFKQNHQNYSMIDMGMSQDRRWPWVRQAFLLELNRAWGIPMFKYQSI